MLNCAHSLDMYIKLQFMKIAELPLQDTLAEARPGISCLGNYMQAIAHTLMQLASGHGHLVGMVWSIS